jgi:2-succinyl-5-enolpyruvyl-6-hydroxy-3-cyclohexene-1-carboxylate synthase
MAATLVDEWVRCGVTHAVVCPGSRSTPLAVALAGHPAMAVHVRLDERSAAFTAVGIGRVVGRPALMVTTSGTAAAELHAAVVEADLGGVPLIVCTADRPPELRQVGAPQTIDQFRLFGGSVRWFTDPGVADDAARGLWRSLASRSVAEAVSGAGGPGPVHLNLPFREPLLGDPDRAGGPAPGRADGGPWHRVHPGSVQPGEAVVRDLVGSGPLQRGRRGLVVAGAGCGDPDAVVALGRALGWPVLADPRSGARRDGPGVITAADAILRSERFAGGHRPEVVVMLGERWVSKVVGAHLVAGPDADVTTITVEPWGRWRDPEREVDAFVRADPAQFCRAVVRHLSGDDPGRRHADGPSGWWGDWQEAEVRARSVIAASLGAGGALAAVHGLVTEPSLAHRLMARMPGTATLVVSSSMPVRDLESFGPARPDPPRVVANRGVNGIDGVVSTALGVALASAGPTAALVGDLAFLHDVSALVRSEGLRADLCVVVADNHGGGIFSFLAPASALDGTSFDTLFGTPQEADVARVAAGFGWEVDDIDAASGPTGLEDAIDRRLGSGSMSVIRVRLPRRHENVDLHRRINAAVVAAVEAVEA